MKQLTAILMAGVLVTAAVVNGQTATAAQEQQAAVVVKEIRQQQAQIAENQAKIDAKLASIVELVRQARIFASRGGRR